mmetsp:Transcript_574/g.521  ORF Transcript_574/g.521 Transcript_574/m.521 type:complete len:84 (-) Transcript_574:1652-1903(-)
MCPIEVLKYAKYNKFIESFDKSCHHIFVNEHLRTREVAFVDEPIPSYQEEKKVNEMVDEAPSDKTSNQKSMIDEEETKETNPA